MRSKLVKASVCLSVFIMLGISWLGGAQALTVSCPAAMAAKFSGNDGCEYVNPFTGPDNDSQTVVNNNSFFGTNTWTITGSVGSSPFLSGTQSGQSGSFTISGLAAGLDALLIVKDGQNTTLVGYLYGANANGTYSWSSPWTNPPFDIKNPKDVSHFSLYTRDSGGTSNDPVPEPASLILLGSGLAGLAWWKKKSNKV